MFSESPEQKDSPSQCELTNPVQMTPPSVFSLLTLGILGNKLELVVPSVGASRRWGGAVVLEMISSAS